MAVLLIFCLSDLAAVLGHSYNILLLFLFLFYYE